jgi:hypothetical protein
MATQHFPVDTNIGPNLRATLGPHDAPGSRPNNSYSRLAKSRGRLYWCILEV